MAIGHDGTIYLASVFGGDSDDEDSGIQVNTSTDGGHSWSEPVVAGGGGPRNKDDEDFPRVVAGKTAGEAWVGWFTWRPEKVPLFTTHLAKTTEHGRNWSELSGPPQPTGTVFPPFDLHLLGERTLVSVMIAADSADVAAAVAAEVLPQADATPADAVIAISRSLDGGRTWDNPVEIGRLPFPRLKVRDPDRNMPVDRLRADSAVDPTTQDLHVVWQAEPDDVKGWRVLHRTVQVPERENRPIDLGDTHVAATTGGPAFQPTLGVDGAGTVGLALYDFDDDVRGNTQTDVTARLHRSFDGGLSWVSGVLVGPFDLRGSVSEDGLFVGNQHALTGTSRGFLAALTVAGGPALGEKIAIWTARVGRHPPRS